MLPVTLIIPMKPQQQPTAATTGTNIKVTSNVNSVHLNPEAGVERLNWSSDYGLQVATSSSFTNLLVNETGITNLYYDIAPGILNWNTTYYWRVNARNSFGSTSSWSSSRYFKTAVGPPPNAPSNLVATPIS